MSPLSNLTTLTALAAPYPIRGVQSAFDPKAHDAGRIAEIGWTMFIGSAGIFLLVMVMLTLALYGPPRLRALLGRRWVIIGAGIAFPVVVLTALLFYTLNTASSLMHTSTPPTLRIEVIGEMWWWRVRYLDNDGQPLFETANDIRIPSGLPVDLVLKSHNVIHSFWVPNLAGKLDMIPGRENRLRVQAQEPGLFRGQCAEYCGAQHAKMSFHVEALTPGDFQMWLALQGQPAKSPTTAQLEIGKQHFMQACAQCHAIRGTEATGSLGPDLTHVGSRHSLAAGALPNNVGSLAGWIAGSQHIKPGNQMPSFNQFSGEGLRALAQYMESLK